MTKLPKLPVGISFELIQINYLHTTSNCPPSNFKRSEFRLQAAVWPCNFEIRRFELTQMKLSVHKFKQQNGVPKTESLVQGYSGCDQPHRATQLQTEQRFLGTRLSALSNCLPTDYLYFLKSRCLSDIPALSGGDPVSEDACVRRSWLA